MRKIYNKLVRDNIINIIEKSGNKAKFHILNNLEYKKELELKLLEEYNEFISAKTKEEKINELADMLELIKCNAYYYGFTDEELIDTCNKKRNTNGSFKNKIFLEEVTD